MIEIGPDIDTVNPQRVHIVLGTEHEAKETLCGTDTLWGYYPGPIESVTCTYCLRGIRTARGKAT